MFLSLLGDALWIAAMVIMVGVSRHAASRIPQDVKVPISGVRLDRTLALWALPGAAFLLSLWFLYAARTHATDADKAFLIFGVRAVAASAIALLHLRWTGAALKTLEREGALKP